MAQYVTTSADYWIASTAITITLNALGEPNRTQGSVVSGAVIMLLREDITAGGDNGDGLGYGANHEPKRWPLSLSPTYFNTDTAKYVYVAVPRSSTVGTQAVVVFPSEQLDIYGRSMTTPADSQSTAKPGDDDFVGRQVGSTDYFYVWLQAIISEVKTLESGQRGREWVGGKKPESGKLSTSQGMKDKMNEGEWYSWSSVTQVVTFLKEIVMGDNSIFRNLKAAVATIEQELVSKGKALFEGDVIVNGLLTAYNAVMNSIKSSNYTGDGVADSGWLITNDYAGSSRAVFDYLYIRKKAVFESLEIKELQFTSGDLAQSLASATLERTDYLEVDEQGNETLLGYSVQKIPWTLKGFLMRLSGMKPYALARTKRIRITLKPEDLVRVNRIRCYFLAKDDDKKIFNLWKENDLARCQTFNIDNIDRATYAGETHKAGNVFWWRLVKGYSTEAVTIDGKEYHYFDVAYGYTEEQEANRTGIRTAWCDLLSDLPAAGDKVVQFGNTSDPARMNIIVSEVNGEGNVDAPAIKSYRGVHSFNTDDDWWGGESCRKMMLSPSSGVEFYAPSFKFITEYGIERTQVERGAWLSIPFEEDTEHQTFPDYSDDILDENGNFVSRSDGSAKRFVRKCRYYDNVEHKGSTWLCTIAESHYWRYYDVKNKIWSKITDTQYKALTKEEKDRCEEVRNYTTDEPSKASNDWTVSAERGEDGGFKSRVFCRTNTDISNAKVTGGSYDNPIPTLTKIGDSVVAIEWTDGIPQGTEILWSTVCTFYGDGSSSGWSKPAQETDTETLDIEFSPNAEQPVNPAGTAADRNTSATIAARERQGWYDPSRLPADQQMIWRAECKIKNGVYEKKDGQPAWVVSRVLGEKGNNGENSIHLDLDNEHASLVYNSTTGQFVNTARCVATLYDGENVATDATYTKQADGVTLQPFTDGNEAIVTDVEGTTGTVTFIATITRNGKKITRQKVMTLEKSVDKEVYELSISPNAIPYNATTDTPAASSIEVKVFRTDINGNRAECSSATGVSIDGNHYLYLYCLDADGTVRRTYGGYSYGRTFSLDNSEYASYRAVISKTDGTDVLDTENIPVCKSANGSNGKDGADGKDGNDGKDAPVVVFSLNPVLFDGNYSGQPTSTNAKTTTVSVVVAGEVKTITGVTILSKPTKITVTHASSGASRVLTVSPADNSSSEDTYTGAVEVQVTWSGGTMTGYFTTGINRQGLQGVQGEQGIPGPQGKMGRSVYYDGIYDATREYKLTEQEAPYVADNGNYWCRDGEEVSVKGQAPYDGSPYWYHMDHQFKYLITQAFFTEFAKLGSAVFNGDFMFSQEGWRDASGTPTTTNEYNLFRPYQYMAIKPFTKTQVTWATHGATEKIIFSIGLTPGEYTLHMREYVEYKSGDSGLVMTVRVKQGDTVLGMWQFTDHKLPTKEECTFTVYAAGTVTITANLNYDTDRGYMDFLYLTSNFQPNILLNFHTGQASFGGDSVHFENDGSGWLAKRNITWDYAGNASFSGKITTTSGTIGGFTIDETRLYNSNWKAGIDISYEGKTVKIGKNAQGASFAEDAIIRAENTKVLGGSHNTALYLNASGATYNYAFYGNGNGVLNGLMFGFKTSLMNVSNTDGAVGELKLVSGATFIISGAGGNHTAYPPTLASVRLCLGLPSSSTTPFSIEIEIINQTEGNVQLRFRNYTGVGSDYPYLMSPNGTTESGGAAMIELTKGAYLKLRLTYTSLGYRAHRLVYNHE